MGKTAPDPREAVNQRGNEGKEGKVQHSKLQYGFAAETVCQKAAAESSYDDATGRAGAKHTGLCRGKIPVRFEHEHGLANDANIKGFQNADHCQQNDDTDDVSLEGQSVETGEAVNFLAWSNACLCVHILLHYLLTQYMLFNGLQAEDGCGVGIHETIHCLLVEVQAFIKVQSIFQAVEW